MDARGNKNKRLGYSYSNRKIKSQSCGKNKSLMGWEYQGSEVQE